MDKLCDILSTDNVDDIVKELKKLIKEKVDISGALTHIVDYIVSSAAAEGYIDPDYSPIVDILLENGVDIDRRDEYGSTVLMEASYYGKVELVRVLIERGANINIKDYRNRTILERVFTKIEPTHKKIVNLLIDADKSVNIEDMYDKIPRTVKHPEYMENKYDYNYDDIISRVIMKTMYKRLVNECRKLRGLLEEAEKVNNNKNVK